MPTPVEQTIQIDNPATLSEKELNAALENPETIVPPTEEDETPSKSPATQPDKPAEQPPSAASGAKLEEKPAAGEKPKADGKPAEGSADDGSKAKPSTEAKPAAEGKPTETLYAGTFKSIDELKKGLLNVGKPLNYSPKLLETLIAQAEITGKWDQVEAVYVELNKAVSAGKKVEQAASPQPAAPDKAVTTTADEDLKVIRSFAVDEAFKSAKAHPIAKQLAEQGFTFPTTKEEWKQLQIDAPYLATKLDEIVTRFYRDNLLEAQEYLKAEKEATGANATAKQEALNQIRTYATSVGLEVTDDELQRVIEAAPDYPRAVEIRHGVPFLKKDGVFELWYLQRREAIEQSIRHAAEVKGRTQAAADIGTLQAKARYTISTAPAPGAKLRPGTPAIDTEDEGTMRSLTDKQLDEAIAKGIPATK